MSGVWVLMVVSLENITTRKIKGGLNDNERPNNSSGRMGPT